MRVPATHEFLLYLEGVRCAFNNATISVQANQPATATISVPPVLEVLDLQPRTLVHLFYRDPELAGKDADEADLFRLLFEGELVGRSFSKDAAGNRTATLHCMDLSNYFFYSYAFYFPDFTRGLFGLVQSIFFGSDTNSQQRANTVGTQSKADKAVTPDTKLGSQLISGLLATLNENGVVASFQEVFRLTKENNEFFRLANRRLRLVDELGSATPPRGKLPSNFTAQGQPALGATPQARRGKVIALKDPESILLFAGSLASTKNSAMEGMFAWIRGQFPATFRLTQVMEKLMSTFYYQYWPVPTAPAVEGNAAETGADGFRINSFIIKPTTFYTAPPASNVLFPDLYKSFSTQRMFLEEPTRLLLRTPPGAFGRLPLQHAFLAPAALQAAVAEFINRPSDNPNEPPRDLIKQIKTPISLPGFLFNEIDITERADTPIGLLYRTLMASADLPPESREDIKGIIDREIQLPVNTFAASLLRLESETDPKTGEKRLKPDTRLAFQQYLTNIASFELFLSQHESRSVTVTGPFNPYFIPGFPFAILDEVTPIIAEAGSVTWFVSADGDATTTISGVYARDRDVIRTITFPSGAAIAGLNPNLIVAPFFFPFAYRPEIIGSDRRITVTSHRVTEERKIIAFEGEQRSVRGAYPELFGDHRLNSGDKAPLRSLVQDFKGFRQAAYKFLQFGTPQSPGAVRLALNDNRRESDENARANRAWEFVRRNVASLRQVFTYIGAQVKDIELIDSTRPDITEAGLEDLVSPFRKGFREPALAFRKAALPGRVGVNVGAEIGRGILAT